MFFEELKIPKQRVAVVIGKKGETKKLLERKTNTKIRISRDGEVAISSDENINIFNAHPIILAIGRGFNPDIALMLLDENYILELISLKDFTKNEKDLIRIRARIIGREGKAWKMIATLSDAFISVYGKTVAVISKIEDAGLAKRAGEKLLKGAPHGNVYKYIEMEKKKSLMQR
jgi:ribosomal RNA assembly protein